MIKTRSNLAQHTGRPGDNNVHVKAQDVCYEDKA